MIFGTDLSTSQDWPDGCMEEQNDRRPLIKDFNTVLTLSGEEILYLRALQGHSGRNPIVLTLQGQCVNFGQFPRVHSSYWMCSQLYTPSQIQD